MSIVLPAKNEADSLKILLPALRKLYNDAEILVVDDGSEDNTAAICDEFNVNRIHHPYSMGNGAAIKSGARRAKGKTIIFMDADSQHDPANIADLTRRYEEGYDMVVGARSTASHASIARLFGNGIFNRFASWITGHKIADLTSGFRLVNAQKFREFLHLLPNGFSYPTSITMAFFRVGYTVSYVPTVTKTRLGQSHIRLLRDGMRFLVIIFKVGTLYSPLKVFLPVSALFFCVGLGYYTYTFINFGRFTNMSALLLINSILIFLIGLVSEQITIMIYGNESDRAKFSATSRTEP